MCNNVLELASNLSTIFNVIELYTDLTYDSDDEKFNWGKFWAGIGMVIAAITAIVIAATTFGTGKGYKSQGNGRWVSKDGLRQLRLDKTRHLFNGNPSKTHFNAEFFKINYWQNKRVPINHKKGLHIFYDLFKIIIK